MSSQWPVVVSLPFERSTSRPAIAGAPGCGGQPCERRDVAETERLEVRQVEAADRPRDVAERVGDTPSSPYSAASGRAPAPTASSTMTHARGMGLF